MDFASFFLMNQMMRRGSGRSMYRKRSYKKRYNKRTFYKAGARKLYARSRYAKCPSGYHKKSKRSKACIKDPSWGSLDIAVGKAWSEKNPAGLLAVIDAKLPRKYVGKWKRHILATTKPHDSLHEWLKQFFVEAEPVLKKKPAVNPSTPYTTASAFTPTTGGTMPSAFGSESTGYGSMTPVTP